MAEHALQDDLDALIRRVDPDRWLSSRFIADPLARRDVIALYAYEHELARAPRRASSALLGEMRLTWWREALEEIFESRTLRSHPAVLALAGAVRRHDLPRQPLEAMIDARYRELDPAPMTDAEAADWARDGAGTAAALAARILDPASDTEAARRAGAAWALARRGFPADIPAARRAAASLSVAAFPAVAHATLASRPGGSEPGRRLRLLLAVALGRI